MKHLPDRDYVFAEDNYQVMLRSQIHKLVYYIGQEPGELYDLEADPHELDNLWHAPAYIEIKQQLHNELLSWLATSTYYNAGYKRGQQRHYTMRWPGAGDAGLHGGNLRPKQVDVL